MPWEKPFDEQFALERAPQIFWLKGYEATLMQDLVDSMGLNRGSLHATYGDKRALFLNAVKVYDQKRQLMFAEFEAQYPLKEAIRHVFQAFTGDLSPAGGNRGCFLTNTALELADQDAQVRSLIALAQEDVEAFLERLIRKGKAAGEISLSIQPVETARGRIDQTDHSGGRCRLKTIEITIASIKTQRISRIFSTHCVSAAHT